MSKYKKKNQLLQEIVGLGDTIYDHTSINLTILRHETEKFN